MLHSKDLINGEFYLQANYTYTDKHGHLVAKVAYICRKGKHRWYRAKDAKKCCDGIHERCLIIGDISNLFKLGFERQSIAYDTVTERWYAFSWRNKLETETDNEKSMH